MSDLAEQLEQQRASFGQLRIPDLWQQEAVAALRAGKDVVVHAPTGAGKTLVFELWSNEGRCHGQCIYTVPTRALANDKLAEWRGRGWNVGIATGDLADNLEAPVLVATLETQKNRLIRGDGPRLLVVDEYQMIGDPDRGLNYEIAVALAPEKTQLLLLSGSVHNPHQVVEWLGRLGRDAVLVRHEERPVPLEEVWAGNLNHHVPSDIRGYWPRYLAKALAEGLGPVLVFAPRRAAAEQLASELARCLPLPEPPLQLTAEQKQLAGDSIARLLKSRIAYHHSGLSYAVRAGLIEPLAKAGQLRIVVATMGLAAGINFSLRSVALAGDSYRRDFVEHPLRSDEVLQMFGRAGRRGIDETGYVLVTSNELRLRDGHPSRLARSGLVDWGALLSVMAGASARGEDPYVVAVRVQERLFTSKPIYLGVEESLKHPVTPCGLKTDSERARHVRTRVREMLNSRGEWEPLSAPREVQLGLIFAHRSVAEKWKSSGKSEVPGAPDEATDQNGSDTAASGDGPEGGAEGASPGTDPTPVPEADPAHASAPDLVPALTVQAALDKVGQGWLVALGDTERGRIYGRAFKVADVLVGDRVVMVKWVRRLTQWQGRVATMDDWERQIRPGLEAALGDERTPVVKMFRQQHKITAYVSLSEMRIRVPVDRHGVALWRPPEREVPQPSCEACELVKVCRNLSPATGTAALWRRLKLVDDRGVPTLSGRVVAALSQTAGLAVAAAMHDEGYPLDELVYDLANLDAGFRFAGEDSRWGGHLAIACQTAYGTISIPGYLENGLPPKYGAGADDVARLVHRHPDRRHQATTQVLGEGDVDRLIIEWRSLLRQIAHAPSLEWPRWTAFQHLARGILREVESPTVTDLPEMPYAQTRRIDHKLVFRRR